MCIRDRRERERERERERDLKPEMKYGAKLHNSVVLSSLEQRRRGIGVGVGWGFKRGADMANTGRIPMMHEATCRLGRGVCVDTELTSPKSQSF